MHPAMALRHFGCSFISAQGQSQRVEGCAGQRRSSVASRPGLHSSQKAAGPQQFSWKATLIAAALLGRGSKLRARQHHIREVHAPGGELPPQNAFLPTFPARAARVTAVYLGAIGAALLIAPVSGFSLFFEAKRVTGPWIRVYGALCVLISWYSEGAATGGNRGFLKAASFSGRLGLVGALAVLAVAGDAPYLMLLAAINAAAAMSVRRALARESHVSSSQGASG
eukprot:TRINITY_DN44529_c0_g1_i1.p1 TRINITY_DN44529_c0_g1~~TRINITY_DN44529_c0_g1_i1.p1  ORF type:complete len:225 (+),score=32.70 TRINITY_DN44529_c0_g1_i1:28-702(+)